MPNTTNYGIPYPISTDAISADSIGTIANSANSVVNTTGKLTTKGDLPIASDSTAIARLPVGGNGSYLLSAGTASPRFSWSGSFSGTYQNALDLIATTQLGTATSSITFSSIPSTYSMLLIRGSYRGVGDFGVLGLRFNSNTGSAYFNSYGRLNGVSNAVVTLNSGTFVDGTATLAYIAPIGGYTAHNSLSGRTAGGRNVANVSASQFYNTEIYIPEYTSTAGTFRTVFATTTSPQKILKPDFQGGTSTSGGIKYFHFAEPILDETDFGRSITFTSYGNTNADHNTSAGVLFTGFSLDRGSKDSGNSNDDLIFNTSTAGSAPNLVRSATGGTTTLNLGSVQRPGLMTGDTFIITGYAGTALGVNGTWAASSVTTSGTSIITYISGAAGTIATAGTGGNMGAGAYLYMSKSGYFYNGTATLSHNPSPATAYFATGGVNDSIFTVASSRYEGNGTAISSIQISGPSNLAVGSVFQLYGVK